MKFAGQPVPHESARAHVTGEALYTDDLLQLFPRALHAWPVLSPYAHALIKSIDSTTALSQPGVATVLTTNDVPGEGDSGCNRHDEPIFPTEVLFHSQPVAWVLADSLSIAQRAAQLVTVVYEPLPAILTIDDAIAANAFHSRPIRQGRGDISRISESGLYFEGELRIGGQEHFYLETQSTLAWVDETAGISLHSSTQHPAETQEIVSRVLGIGRNQVTVECLRMGGAFGGKESQANPYAAIAALGAWKTGRPVRVRLTRALDFALTGKRHPFLACYEAGFSSDGRIEALRLELYADGGWSLDLSEPIVSRALFHSDNAYFIPNVHLTGLICRTHKTSQTAFRGFGGPQGMVVIEEIMDQAARRLGLPPEQVRQRNFYREGDTTHYGQPVKDAARIHTIWSQLLETSTFHSRRDEINIWNAAHPHTKRGLAITPVKFGISFTAQFYNQAGALVLIYRDGTVQVNHGGTEMGQGLQSKIQQIAAEALNLDPAKIRVMSTRTDKIPNTSATAASSGTDLNGAAVADACRILCRRLNEVDAGRALPFNQLVEAAYKLRVPLFAQGFYRTPGIHYDPVTAQGQPFYYFAYGAAVSEVEIDGFTGAYRLLRADLLEDVGDSVSPLIDRGQVEGGFIQGVGWLTLEELVWDGNGRLATNGASTYKLPSWTELPDIFNVDFLPRAAEAGTIFGSKAVGEPPLMLAISVREALRDAIAAFGKGGPVDLESPATPERVFFAIQKALNP